MTSLTKSYILLIGVLILSSVAVITLGDTPWNIVWEKSLARLAGETLEWNPLLDERLPRLIVLICTGASLAVAGLIVQSLFQNPLASPSVLGISCGSCLLVLPVFISGWHIAYPYAVPLAAVLGALLTLLLVYALSIRGGKVHLTTLILTGIAISTLFIAIQGAVLYALRDEWQLIQLITEWEAGSTADRTWRHVHMQLPLTLVGLWIAWFYRDEINLLSLGDEEALNLGVDVSLVRWRLFIAVALLTGGAIAALGVIAFLGLLMPHLIRKMRGPDARQMVPLCILAGASALAITDVGLRLFEIHALSIGNVLAIVGGTLFLFLLLQRREEVYQ
jgi:iron complex transport system permease protein